jgi:hypothetical protein
MKAVNQWLRTKGRKDARIPPGQWTRQADILQWRIRAEAFDAWELAEGEKRHREETDRLFEHIHQALRAAYGKITARLQALDPDELPAVVVIPQAIQLIKKLEEINGRTVAARVELSGPGGAPIKVDIEERQKVLRELDELERTAGIDWQGPREQEADPD